MWTRAQLKEKAKYACKLNYWKVVAVAFLMSLLVGGIGTASGSGASTSAESSDAGYDFSYNISGMDIDMTELAMFMTIFWLVFPIVLLIALVISFVWMAFIGNPVMVGANKFFFKSLNQKAEVKELLSAFDGNYKNVATIMFYKTLYEMLWSLLFIVPGIVKKQEYRMIPYLLAENPNLTKEQAFALSKQMMDGQKWDAFVLDLSFIGWEMLSGMTLGILGIFYVNPYVNMTNAALYEELSLLHGHPAQTEPIAPEYQNVWQQGASADVNFNSNEE